jgi:GDP-L-fucose synthase
MKVLITGGRGFLGTRLTNILEKDKNIEFSTFRSSELDLKSIDDTRAYFKTCRPDAVIHLAARVGGIEFNKTRHAEQLYENVTMLFNILEAARNCECRKIVLCGSVCAYSGDAPVPFSEETGLYSGVPEKTVFGYGNAKRFFLTAAEAYRKQYGMEISLPILANLYGPGDDFNLATCHVIPAMINRFSDCIKNGVEEVTFWGTGNASREFLYVDDAAEIIINCLDRNIEIPFNVGSGEEITMSELAELIGALVGFKGKIMWDTDKPDGHPRRKLDLNRFDTLFPHWKGTRLNDGLKSSVEYFRSMSS